jgi:hypothetical protein
MAEKDFILKYAVNQRGATEYSKEMKDGAARAERAAAAIDRVRMRGVRLNANARGLSAAMRREAARRDRDRQRVITAANDISRGLQAAVVKEIGIGLRRPGGSTGKLAKVTASGRNRGFTTSRDVINTGVGRFSWLLNNKQVDYALAIEGGTRKHVGRSISGLWIASTGRPTGFGKPTKTARFVAMRAQDAAKTLVAAGRKNFRVAGVIRKEIVAHKDYRAALTNYQPKQRMLAEIRRIYGA